VTALWLTPWYDNVNHANTKEKYTREQSALHQRRRLHGLSRLRRGGFLRRGRTLRRSGQTPRTGADGAGARLQVHPGSGRQSHGARIIRGRNNPPTPTWFNGTPENHLDNSWQIWTIAATNPPADKLKVHARRLVHQHPARPQPKRSRDRHLSDPKFPLVDRHDRSRRVRQDTLPYVPRSYWAQWTRGVEKGVSATHHPRRNVGPQARAGRISSRAAANNSTAWIPASIPCLISRFTTRCATSSPKASP
jgi:hypothetical protein